MGGRKRFYSCQENMEEVERSLKIRNNSKKRPRTEKTQAKTVKTGVKHLPIENRGSMIQVRCRYYKNKESELEDVFEDDEEADEEEEKVEKEEERSPERKKKKCQNKNEAMNNNVNSTKLTTKNMIDKEQSSDKDREENIEKGKEENEKKRKESEISIWCEEDVEIWDKRLKEINEKSPSKECIDCEKKYHAEYASETKKKCIICNESEHGCLKENSCKLSKGYVWICKECKEITESKDVDILEKIREEIMKITKDKKRSYDHNDINKRKLETESKMNENPSMKEASSNEKKGKVRSLSDSGILNYQKTTISQSDLISLNGCNWINDSIISLWSEHLQKEVYRENNRILFLSPSVTQAIKIGERKDIPLILNPTEAWLKNYIFLPVNDNVSPSTQGGNHWSLLIYSKNDKMWYHFDSIQGSNNKHARNIVERLNIYLDFKDTPVMTETKCTQQNDSYNCGAFVMLYTQIMANRTINNIPLGDACYVNRQEADHMRKRVLDLVQKKGSGEKTQDIRKGTEKETAERVNPAQEQELRKTIEHRKTCTNWVRGDCRQRQICPFGHPQLCPEILETGECTDLHCSLYHPKICRNSKNYGKCLRGKSCYFTHIKRKVWKTNVESYPKQNFMDKHESYQNKENKNNDNNYKQQRPKPQNYSNKSAWSKNREDFLEHPAYLNWEILKTPIMERAAEILAERMMRENHHY